MVIIELRVDDGISFEKFLCFNSFFKSVNESDSDGDDGCEISDFLVTAAKIF